MSQSIILAIKNNYCYHSLYIQKYNDKVRLNNMRKKICLSLLLVLMTIGLVACGTDEPIANDVDSYQQEIAEVSNDVVDEVSYPITLTDQAGREVVLNHKPESIVSSYYITTSAFLALGLNEQIVGIESNPEKRNIYKMCAPEVMEVAQVGSPKEFDLEVCASLEPDLVVLPMRAKDMVEPLEQLGIPVIVVNPESQTEIMEMLQLIGTAMDCIERADKLCGYIQEKTDDLSEKTADCERPLVYLGGNSSFLSTASKGMYQNDLITLAGGQNVAGDIEDTYWVESSYEQILAWNPEVIALASEAKYSLDEVLTDSYLQDCQAIQGGKVYAIPSDIEAWDSPVPSSFLGAVYLASVLHPDLVSEDEYEDMVEEYYEIFYGFSYEEK